MFSNGIIIISTPKRYCKQDRHRTSEKYRDKAKLETNFANQNSHSVSAVLLQCQRCKMSITMSNAVSCCEVPPKREILHSGLTWPRRIFFLFVYCVEMHRHTHYNLIRKYAGDVKRSYTTNSYHYWLGQALTSINSISSEIYYYWWLKIFQIHTR